MSEHNNENERNAEMSEQLNCKLKGADRWIQNVERNLSCLFDELEKTNESIQELHKSLTRLLEIRRETLAAAESLRIPNRPAVRGIIPEIPKKEPSGRLVPNGISIRSVVTR